MFGATKFKFFFCIDDVFTPLKDCPPEGQWKYTWPDLYGRVFTYAKRSGVKIQHQPEEITICGDPTSRYTGTYTKKSENHYTIGEFSEGTARELYYDSKNKIWVLMEPVFGGATEGMGQYHTTKGFDLFGARWQMAKNDVMAGHAYLPGHVESNKTHWEDAPLSFIVVDYYMMPCPYYPIENSGLNQPVIPNEVYVCGNDCVNCPDVFGRYELKEATDSDPEFPYLPGSNGFPYYKIVSEPEDGNNRVIWFNNYEWVITYGLGE